MSEDGSLVVGTRWTAPGPGELPTLAYRWTSSTGMVDVGLQPAGRERREGGVS